MKTRKLIGCARIAVVFIAALAAAYGQTPKTLHDFAGTDGGSPSRVALFQASDGNLYGTTSFNGSANDGTVFKITTAGALTTLYNFAGLDGMNPYAGLIQASDGNFYGTTHGGGLYGFGTVFQISPLGTLTTLHSFNGTDGESPDAALTQGTDGSLYSTTYLGGSNGDGTVFKITTAGAFTLLHSFSGTDGANPVAALSQAVNGSFYGATFGGGANGYGTVFKISPSGNLTTLHNFNVTDGDSPYGTPILASDGNFYGTTAGGGSDPSLAGTIYKVTPAGTLTTLHSFNVTDGQYPSGLTQATDGQLYGGTLFGGTNVNVFCSNLSCGVLFKISTTGTFTDLYDFCALSSCVDGAVVVGPLAQVTDGNLYGTTFSGGTDSSCVNGAYTGCGTVFRLSLGLKQFVEARPAAGKVGANVVIVGSNLSGATSVTFNGTAASFTVVSRSEITTTVPVGATTGRVKVTTAQGTLQSNVVFRILP